MKRFLSLAVVLMMLTLAGHTAGMAAPVPSAAPTEDPSVSLAPEATIEQLQTGLFAEQIFSGAEGDIHYSYYLPKSYDASRI